VHLFEQGDDVSEVDGRMLNSPLSYAKRNRTTHFLPWRLLLLLLLLLSAASVVTTNGIQRHLERTWVGDVEGV